MWRGGWIRTGRQRPGQPARRENRPPRPDRRRGAGGRRAAGRASGPVSPQAPESWVGPAASLVSTMGDLNRFYGELPDGKIVSRSSLAQMQRTVPSPRPGRNDDRVRPRSAQGRHPGLRHLLGPRRVGLGRNDVPDPSRRQAPDVRRWSTSRCGTSWTPRGSRSTTPSTTRCRRCADRRCAVAGTPGPGTPRRSRSSCRRTARSASNGVGWTAARSQRCGAFPRSARLAAMLTGAGTVFRYVPGIRCPTPRGRAVVSPRAPRERCAVGEAVPGVCA